MYFTFHCFWQRTQENITFTIAIKYATVENKTIAWDEVDIRMLAVI